MLDGPQRYACLVGGTRSGKTFLILRAIVTRAHAVGGLPSRHSALPRQRRARLDRARFAAEGDASCFPGAKLRERRQDGYFELENGARIWVGGLDDKDRVEKFSALNIRPCF